MKSHRTILRGIFIGWTSVFVILIIVNLSSIYFVMLTGLVSFFSLITLFSLEDQIKEAKNTLTEKKFILQQLAKKSKFVLKKTIFLILFLLCQNHVSSKDMILDKLNNPKLTNQSQK